MEINNIKEAKELILALDDAEFIQKELENMGTRNNAAHDCPIIVANLVNFVGRYPNVKDDLASFMGKKVEEIKDHHIHHNPHHWQYWVLINDDPDEGTIGLDIPLKWVIEMICDWWSFSWKTGNLYEIFDWYEKNKNRMILSKNTRELIEQILGQIKEKLDEQSKKEGD